MEEQKLREFEKRLLKTIFGRKKEKITGG